MPVTNYYSVDGLLIGEKTTGGSRIDYLTDMLGSVKATVDQTAQVRNTYRYKPSGELLAKTGTDPDPTFGWIGTHGYRPTKTKFSDFYVRRRHCDTSTGRWPNVDPFYPLLPAYGYVAGNPVTYADPSGLMIGVTPSCSSWKNLSKSVSGCCDRLHHSFGMMMSTSDGKYPSTMLRLLDCVNFNIDVGTQLPDIYNAINWLLRACNSSTSNICLWCNDDPRLKPSPEGWPPDCPNPCGGRGGGALVPSDPIVGKGGEWVMPFDPQYSSCVPFTRPLAGCETLAHPPVGTSWGNGTKTDEKSKKGRCAAIVLCPDVYTGNTSGEFCGALFHEIIHSGGELHRVGPTTGYPD